MNEIQLIAFETHNSTKEVTIFKEHIIAFYLNLQTIISMPLEKKKGAILFRRMQGIPTHRCGTLPYGVFLVFYSCLLF